MANNKRKASRTRRTGAVLAGATPFGIIYGNRQGGTEGALKAVFIPGAGSYYGYKNANHNHQMRMSSISHNAAGNQGGPLSPAQRQQRKNAAKAPRHKGR